MDTRDPPDDTRLRTAAAAVLCFATVFLVALSDGGWWPTTWGWAALGLLFVAAAALILQPVVRLWRLDLALLAGLAALTAWTALSLLWSGSPPRTVLEVERLTMYLGGALALLLVVRRRSLAAALGGLLAASAVLCGYALATRLVPDHLDRPGSSLGFRLAGELGYPNALGIVAALGLLLALGFVVDSPRAAVRAGAAASTVPLVLALYLSNSRGSWVSLALGLGAAVGLTPRRGRLLRACAPLAAVGGLAIWLTSRSRPLTLWVDPRAAAEDGHLLLVAAVILAVAVAVVSARPARRAVVVALVAAALAVVVAPSSPGPVTAAAGAGAGPVAPGAPSPGTTPAGRLLSATSNSRTEYWRVAVIDFLHHPVAGSGAGTFVREWYRERPIDADVQNAHSLYLEILAELGVVGLALLLVVVAIPLVAARRARGAPYVAGAFGAFAAFAAHAAVDWDWQLPAVTLAGLFCGGLLVVAARGHGAPLLLDRRPKGVAIALVLMLGTLSFAGLVGNRAYAAAFDAAARGDWVTAEAEARRAARWAPWSADAHALTADALSARAETARARASLRRAVQKDASDYRLWKRLASMTTGAERRAALQRAAALNPRG